MLACTALDTSTAEAEQTSVSSLGGLLSALPASPISQNMFNILPLPLTPACLTRLSVLNSFLNIILKACPLIISPKDNILTIFFEKLKRKIKTYTQDQHIYSRD